MKSAADRTSLTRHLLASDSAQAYLLYVPSTRRPGSPVVVAVHGVSRNIHAYSRLLSPYAEMYGAVLVVPHFAASRFGDYQRLGRSGRGMRADLTLNRIVAEAAAMASAEVERFHLFGYGAGAQFVHRYAMAWPQRVASAVIANSGWYTFPDAMVGYPLGIRSARDLPGVVFEPDKFLRVPMRVFVGTGGIEKTAPRRSQPLDLQQGESRLERTRNWVAAMNEASQMRRLTPLVTHEELPNAIRSFRRSVLRAGLADRAFEVMFGAPVHSSG